MFRFTQFILFRGDRMELKDIYQTMVEDWKWVRLGEVCKVEVGFPFKSQEFIEDDDGIPIIDIENFEDNRIILNETNSYLPYNKIQFYEDFITRENDILISLSGATIGKVGIVKDMEIALFNQRVGRFNINTNQINKTFLFFLLNSNEFYNFVLNRFATSSQSNISPSVIESFEFPLPPLPEQEIIVFLLQMIGNPIKMMDKIIKRYKRIKQGFKQD
jgi:restriction endonuclease S subunit